MTRDDIKDGLGTFRTPQDCLGEAVDAVEAAQVELEAAANTLRDAWPPHDTDYETACEKVVDASFRLMWARRGTA